MTDQFAEKIRAEFMRWEVSPPRLEMLNMSVLTGGNPGTLGTDRALSMERAAFIRGFEAGALHMAELIERRIDE